MAGLVKAPFTVEWGAVVLNNIQNITADFSSNIEELDLVDGSTLYLDGTKKAEFSFQVVGADVTELAKSLVDLHVADAGTLANATVVASADTQGLIEIANKCSATNTTASLVLKDCTGAVRATLLSGRMIFENYELLDNTDQVTVKCVSTATDTKAYIGQQ